MKKPEIIPYVYVRESEDVEVKELYLVFGRREDKIQIERGDERVWEHVDGFEPIRPLGKMIKMVFETTGGLCRPEDLQAIQIEIFSHCPECKKESLYPEKEPETTTKKPKISGLCYVRETGDAEVKERFLALDRQGDKILIERGKEKVWEHVDGFERLTISYGSLRRWVKVLGIENMGLNTINKLEAIELDILANCPKCKERITQS